VGSPVGHADREPAKLDETHVGPRRAYRSLIGKYRCLVVADGFYEWTVGQDGKKQPIYFRLTDGGLFAFAGLWTCRTDDAGELVESCTIVTTGRTSWWRRCMTGCR
jgi:putative SOS response-associated peptidase YedK